MPILNACANCKTRYEHRARPEPGRRTSSISTGRGASHPSDLTAEHRVYFSSSANGLICRDCEASFPDKIKLSSRVAACLSNLKMISESNEKTLNEIEKIFISHFTELLGHRPKMAKHILKS